MKRLLLLALVAAVMAACSGRAPAAAQPTPTPVVIYADPTEVAGPFDEEPTDEAVAPVAVPRTYETLGKRGWAKVVKSPDTYAGRGYKLVACIYQFDGATGDDGFLAQASWHKEPYWYTDGQNAAFTGTAAKLAPFVEGDIVSMSVTTLGSYSYDTQAGGNTTVPSFRVDKIKQEKGSCE
jgi:hypothetical protein